MCSRLFNRLTPTAFDLFGATAGQGDGLGRYSQSIRSAQMDNETALTLAELYPKFTSVPRDSDIVRFFQHLIVAFLAVAFRLRSHGRTVLELASVTLALSSFALETNFSPKKHYRCTLE